MEQDYHYSGLYKPVSYKKRDCCRHNELRNEMARNEFMDADTIQLMYLECGKSAILIAYKEDQDTHMISTSSVEDITEENGAIQITTKNSVYVMALSGAAQESDNGN